MEVIGSSVGCIACRIDGRTYVPCDVNHIIENGKRKGHRYTYGLCPAHHRPEFEDARVGPNLKNDPHGFRERYGDDDYLLQLTDEWLGYLAGHTIGRSDG